MPSNRYALLKSESLIQKAVRQSGINGNVDPSFLLYKNSRSDWLDAPIVQDTLKLLTDLLGEKTRKFGRDAYLHEVLELTHVIWCAHHAYNDPVLNKAPVFRKAGVKPLTFALAALLHDFVEEHREHHAPAEASDRIAYLKLEKLLDGYPYKDLVLAVVRYMTDEADLKGSPRVKAQENKSIVNTGRAVESKVGLLHQAVRLYDKLHQVTTDSYNLRMRHIDTDQAQHCFDKALSRAYVAYFTAFPFLTKIYMIRMRSLVPQGRGTHTPLPKNEAA